MTVDRRSTCPSDPPSAVSTSRHAPSWLAGFGVALVRGYQFVFRPIMPPCCRFHPSCSDYAILALRKHGFWKGSLLAAWRILRCNPFCQGGVDYP